MRQWWHGYLNVGLDPIDQPLRLDGVFEISAVYGRYLRVGAKVYAVFEYEDGGGMTRGHVHCGIP